MTSDTLGSTSTMPRHQLRVGAVAVLLLACQLALLPTAFSQPADDDSTSAADRPTSLTLDIEALLLDERSLSEQIEASPWQIQPAPGRRLVALPLLISPPEQTDEITSTSHVSVRGGRLLAWLIEIDQPGESDGTADAPTLPDDPEGVPLLARRLTVHPDGRVAWSLERTVPNATLSDPETPYALRIRPEQIRDLEPERPGRVDARGGESRREIELRQREADQAYREDRRAFMEMRREVMALPDAFEASQPMRIWGVYELADATRELIVSINHPTLSWSIRLDDLVMLRELAGAGNRRGSEPMESLNDLTRLAGDGHALNHRLVALALIRSNLVPQVEPNDALYNLLQTLSQSEDASARRAILSELAAVTPPSNATLMLLRAGTEHADPTMNLLALRGLLRADPADPERLAQMVSSANQMLADPAGPEPALVLDELVQAIGTGVRDELIPEIATGVTVNNLQADRLEATIDYIVSSAGEHLLSAAWLDRQLLVHEDVEVVRTTLDRVAALPGSEDATASREEANGRIPVSSSSHSLFELLASDSDATRERAWQALGHFWFASEGRSNRRRGSVRAQPADEGDEPDRYEALLDAGLSRPSTPEQLVPFLDRQPHADRAAAMLSRVLIEGDDASAEQAGQALLGSGMPIDLVMQSITADEREQVGQRLYEKLEGDAPHMVGLLREEPRRRDSAAEWFARRVAEGALPEPGDWVTAFRNENALLELTGSDDPAVSAGAVAALIYAAGGDETLVAEQIDRFRELRGANRAQLQEAWAAVRRQVYTRQLAEAAGSYRLAMMVNGETPLRVTLGIVDLVADGRTVRFSNDIVSLTVPDDQLGVRIERLVELKNFDHQELNDLPLEDLREPLDMLPAPDGAWGGFVRLDDDRQLELRMEPID